MNETKQFTPKHENAITRNVFWGTIALAAITLLVSAYFFTFLLRESKTPVVYLGMAAFFSGMAAMVASILFTIRGRQELGVKLAFYTLLVLGAAVIGLFRGRAFTAIPTILVITVLAVTWLFPSRSRRKYAVQIAVGAILMVAIEWIDPAWRIQVAAASVGPIGAIVFALVLGGLAVSQFRNYSLRTKLLTGFLLVALVPLGIVFFLNNSTTSQNLTDSSDAALQGVAAETAAALDTFLAERLNDVRTEAQRSILLEYLTLPKAERAGSEAEKALNTDLLAVARRDQTFITSVGLLDANGFSVADTEPTEVGVDKSNRNYFTEARDLPYASPIEISGTTGAISMYFSAPVRDSSGEFIGVLRIRYDATVIQSIVKNSAEQANLDALNIVVFDENHIRLAHNLAPELIFKSVVPLPADMVTRLQSEGRLYANRPVEELSTNIQDMEDGLNNLDQQPFFVAEFHDEGEGNEEGTAIHLETQPWLIAAGQDQDVFLAPLTAQTRTNVILALIIAGIVAFVAVLVAQTISNPVVRLTNVAQQIAGGDIAVQAKVETGDEIGQLASTFNQMTAQLRELIGSLEQRVADRTKALSSVAEVGTAASTILETDKLLQQVVDLTKERFNFYHAHIYLLNAAGDTLVLASGAGEAGRQMVAEKRSISLDREQSLVARAARERKGVTVNDVTETPDFLPNPLLPDTRSELAVPMIAGERVIGVFDVQSELVGRFTDADIAVQTTLSSQIAIAVQNAYQYEETKSALSQSERLFNASDRLSQAQSLQELIKAAVESLGIPAMDRAILGSLGYSAGDELDSMTIVANWSESTELQATPLGTHYSKEVLSSLSLFTSSEPLFFDDMLNDERVDETTKAIARRVNYRSVAALPLFLGSRRDALILLEGKEPHNFTQDEIRLFTALGPQLATILENRRQFERAQEQAKREVMLNAITQKIQSATTIESALQMTARELGRALGMKPTLVTLEPDSTNGEHKSDS